MMPIGTMTWPCRNSSGIRLGFITTIFESRSSKEDSRLTTRWSAFHWTEWTRKEVWRQLMRGVNVRVHEAGHHRRIVKIDLASVVGRRAAADGGHAAAVHCHATIANRPAADRQHPSRAVTDQCEITRSCLPARLRAG